MLMSTFTFQHSVHRYSTVDKNVESMLFQQIVPTGYPTWLPFLQKKVKEKIVKELEKVKEPKKLMRKLGILMVEETGAKTA